jgi:hypothetical protein
MPLARHYVPFLWCLARLVGQMWGRILEASRSRRNDPRRLMSHREMAAGEMIVRAQARSDCNDAVGRVQRRPVDVELASVQVGARTIARRQQQVRLTWTCRTRRWH